MNTKSNKLDNSNNSNPNKSNKFNNMTFGELREELAKVSVQNDPTKETLIRNLMMKRYNQYQKKKNEMARLKHEQDMYIMNQAREEQERQNQNKANNSVKQNNTIKPNKQTKSNKSNMSNIDKFFPDSSINNYSSQQFTDRDLEEYDFHRDRANDCLMDRMQNNIDLRTLKTDTQNSLLKPYSNKQSDLFAAF